MSPQVKTTPRKRPRQARSKATVEAILEATAGILVKLGYEKATTNRIADAAGVSVGSLYQYFPNKQALVAALIDRHAEAMMSVMEAKLSDGARVPLPEAARDIVDAMIDAHRINPRLHKVLMEQVPSIGRMRRLREMSRRVESMVRTSLEARAHEIRRENLTLTAFVLVQAVESLTHVAVLERPDYLGEELKVEITDLIVRYLHAG
jgi:AcrR family transcriptional regulator